jgi:glycosyltransferase involved in cell wall biosynthesis
MRIAFLTTEFPSEHPDAGGLATYVGRIARFLNEAGHQVEVFVTTAGRGGTILYDNVIVHRINADEFSRTRKAALRISRRFIPFNSWNGPLTLLLNSASLARALDRRHECAPFDLVQSADYFATGLFVRRCPARVHAIRCSSATELIELANNIRSYFAVIRGYLERQAMRKADICYSPSHYIADHFKRQHDIDVYVIRPPMQIEAPDVRVPIALPSRYFLHFGMLSAYKGTDLLAAALLHAWKMAPDLTMVWSGVCPDNSKIEKWRSLWGDQAPRVVITGAMSRPQIYSVLQKAEATVIPSLVDNLPNTVIESLSFGIPVLGTRGVSIDELVEEGVTGHLFERGNVLELARVLVKMWNKESEVSKGFTWNSAITKEMEPETAVANLIRLCNLRGESQR